MYRYRVGSAFGGRTGYGGIRRGLRSVTMTEGPEDEATALTTGGELVDLASRRPTVVDEVPLSIAIGGQVLVFGGLRLVPGGTASDR